ncbi:hypothetical protein [Cupriavidus sp. TMH.W2]|uniref:hypothetical protein n=1 Tax=Cupriavidus sp. TMH.W2 TaxID=3434465 RepID=UPI003D789E1E
MGRKLSYQWKIVAMLRSGFRFELMFSPLDGRFIERVRVKDPSGDSREIIQWWRLKRMLERGVLQLDGHTLQTSCKLRLSEELRIVEATTKGMGENFPDGAVDDA